MNKAIFLDRDGTIIKKFPYLNDENKVELLEGVGEGLKRLQSAGFKLIIISNQSGVGRNLISFSQLNKVTGKLRQMLLDQHVTIDDIYYCHHIPEDICCCRKPKTLMFEEAIKNMNIDVKQSYTIGDRYSDTNAGKMVKTNTILLCNDKNKIDTSKYSCNFRPNHIAVNFINAVDWILRL